MHIVIIDNYDSFTYNLYQYIGEILEAEINSEGFRITVKRNDEVTLQDVRALAPDRIIISPGPGTPEDKNYFGVCADVITELGKTTPLLGVCLGMQGIVYCFGGNIKKAKVPMHGKISPVDHNGKGIFANIPPQLEVMRYHSLVADPNTLPDCLERTAEVTDENGETELMAVQHRQYPITGIQFHPESFATEGGRELLANFLFQKA